ncbi:MAG: hypothetical protein FD145_565 [Candidatus Saganbacteria bacterium]|uniref:GNAT family N-acetyltransferase n=1 Tax=Candidatus Saganbacteria bacterium TaxID=2575572 RepID=A0A833L1I1_UNCSA|nr:MAG: hypothetical protein FD145_565 [Candidatus Saganbacteria bacterium]
MTSSEINFRIVDTVEACGKDRWDALVGEHGICNCYDYLLALEKSKINDFRYKYILIYQENTLIFGMVVFVTQQLYLDVPVSQEFKKVINFLRNVFPRFLVAKAIVCGSPIAECNYFSYKSGTNLQFVFMKAQEAIAKLEQEEKINLVVFKDFEENQQVDPHLKKLGFTKVYCLPSTVLKTRYADFKKYLKSLKNKYRANIVNKINKIHCNLDSEISWQIKDKIESIYSLYLQTYERAPVKFEKLNKQFFLDLFSNLPEKKRCLLLFKYNQNIIAFAVLLICKNNCINFRIGMDYSVNKELHVYFHLLYHNIEFCIKQQLDNLYLSQTSYRPKLELGARLYPIVGYLKHRNPIWHRILSLLMKIFFRRYSELALSANPIETLKKIFPEYY